MKEMKSDKARRHKHHLNDKVGFLHLQSLIKLTLSIGSCGTCGDGRRNSFGFSLRIYGAVLLLSSHHFVRPPRTCLSRGNGALCNQKG